MGKKGKRRVERSHSRQKRQRAEKKTAETHIKEGNLKEAIRVLTTQLTINPTDEKRRLLGQCFLDLEDYHEAASTWLVLSEKSPFELLVIGFSFLNKEEWEKARHYLKESLRLQERPNTLYLLALAHIQDRYFYRLDETTVSEILSLLQKARSLPGCHAEVFLLLDNLLRYTHRATEDEKAALEELERTQLLEEAFTLFPDNDDVRIKYASHLHYPLKNYEAVLIVVAPLIAREDPPSEALEYAFASSVEAKLFENALQYIDKLQDEEAGYRSGIAKVKGDILLELGRFDEAIACYQQEMKRDGFTVQFIGIFSYAWGLILQGHSDLALKRAKQGADLWFDKADMYEEPGVFDSEPIRVGTIHIGDNSPALHVKNVCEKLLQEDDLEVSLRGQLCYLLYMYYYTYYSDRTLLVWEQKEEHSKLLLEAVRLFPHPLMYSSLTDFYKEKGDLPCAVKYHLEYCGYIYSHHPDGFEEGHARFYYAEYETAEETKETIVLTKDDRSQIHEIAFTKLKTCQDTAIIKAIFLPFFHSFWHNVLLYGEMYQEIVDVTSIFIREGLRTETDLWNYAYSIWQLGNLDEAEQIYRQYLENYPDDTDTLLNLSILLEEKGLVQEAAILINKAIALDPDNELIIEQHSHLREESKRLEAEEATRQKQEMFLRSAPERWTQVDDVEKKFLYTMTAAERWDGLAQLANKTGLGEQEFQVHWKRLVELGMIFVARENLYQINPYILHFVKDEGLLLHHPALTSILKDIADIDTAEVLLKETRAHLQTTVLGLSEQVGNDIELRDKLIWHLYWKVDMVQQTWLKKAFGLKDKDLREITTKAWVKMICPACKRPHMVNVTTRSEFKRVQDTSWQRFYAKCPACKEAERQKQEEESKASWEAREKRNQELRTMPYKDYLQTPEWEARRKRIMRRDNYRCQVCNARGVRLNVHHKTYDRRGYEDDSDLITLCENCHTIFYEKGKLARS